MASIQKEIHTRATPEQVWDALRDVGALHTRLVPGFVRDTKLEGDVRIVTFGNGVVVREPIVDINDASKRVVWAAIAEGLTHYNGAAQVFPEPGNQSRIVWTADFLPHSAAAFVDEMMTAGAAAMKETLDSLQKGVQ